MAKKFRRVCRELTTVPIVSVPTKNSPLVPTIDSVNTKTSVPVLQSCSEPTETSDSESISPMHVPTTSISTQQESAQTYLNKPWSECHTFRNLTLCSYCTPNSRVAPKWGSLQVAGAGHQTKMILRHYPIKHIRGPPSARRETTVE